VALQDLSGMNPIEAALTVATQALKEQTDRIEARLDQAATKEDVARLMTQLQKTDEKVDHLATKALDSAPPWAVRQIQWLTSIVSAVFGAILLAVGSWVQKHFAGGA
jgi:hypothetical protein